MTLNGRYALYCTKHASFGAHCENLNEVRPTLSGAKCSPANDSTFWQYNIKYNLSGYSRGSLERGRQTTMRLSTTIMFSVSLAISSETLDVRPALSYNDTQSVVGFSMIPKSMSLSGYFALNSVFASVSLAFDRKTFENCAKLIKIDPFHTVNGANLRL